MNRRPINVADTARLSTWTIFIPIALKHGLNSQAMDEVWKIMGPMNLPETPGALVDAIELAIAEWRSR